MDAKVLGGWLDEASAVFMNKEEEVPEAKAPASDADQTNLLGNTITGDTELQESTRELKEESFSALFMRGVRTGNALRGVFDEVVRKVSFEPDDSFVLKDHLPALTADIPSMYHDKFARAQSAEEAWDVHKGIKSDLEDLRVLADNGVKGAVAAMAAGVVDIDAVVPLLGKAATVGNAIQLAADANKISMAQKAIQTLSTAGRVGTAKAIAKLDSIGGGVWAGAKSALITESVLAEVGDTNSWATVPAAILMSGTFGGAIRMSQGLPVGLSTRYVVANANNAAVDLLENAADPYFVRQLDGQLDDNLNAYTGAQVFADHINGANYKQRAANLIAGLAPHAAFASGWLKKARAVLGSAPFADDFTRLWESGSNVGKALAVSLFESAEGLLINNKSGAITLEEFMHKGYKNFAQGHDGVLQRAFEARGFGWADWRAKDEYTKALYRRTIQTANEIRLGRNTNIDPDVAEMLEFVDVNSKFVLNEAKGGAGAARMVPGFETLAEQRAHIPLVWSGEAMQAAIIRLGGGVQGKDALRNAVAQAYLDALPDIDPDTANILAGALINRQMTKAAGMDMDIGYLLSTDGKEFLMNSMELNGMSRADAEAVVDRLTNKEKDKGKIAYARRRTNIDLSGEYNGIQMIDLVEQDLNKIMFQYNDSMGKRVALSRHGLDSKSKIEQIKNAVLEESRDSKAAAGEVQSKEEAVALKEFLDYAFEYFEPGSVNKHINPWMRRAKEATNLSLLSKLGLTQLSETAGIIANAGIRNFIAASDLMQSIVKNSDGGMNRSQIIDDLGWCVGNLGYEKGLMRSDMVQDAVLDATTSSGGLIHTMDDWLQRGQHVQGVLSGYTRVLTGQLQIGALSITNKIFRSLRDGTDITALLKTSGFDTFTATELHRLVNDGTIEFNAAGHVDKLNIDRWTPELRDSYGRAVLRVSFQMTQRALPGESMKWLHSPSTAIFGHLQSFPLLAMRKQFLRTMGRSDDSAKMLIAYGMGTAALASIVKASIEGQDMDIETLVKRSFALNNSLSWAATGVDLTATILGLEDLAPGGRYAGDISLPMLGAAQDALHLPGAVLSLLPGVDFDRQDKRALHVLPVVGRLYGTGWLFESMITE